MKKVKTLLALLITPAMLLGACSSNQGSSSVSSSQIPSSESSSSSSAQPSISSTSSSSSVAPSSSATPSSSSSASSSSSSRASSSSSAPSEKSTSASSESSSSIPSSSSESSSSLPDSSSSEPAFIPYQTVINVEMGASLNAEKGKYQLELAYDDGFFMKDAKAYDKDLSLLSFGSSVVTGEESTVKAFYQSAEFNDVTAYSYESAPTKDSIGYVISHKTIDNFELVAVAVRGFNYGLEWSNNLVIGKTGDHEGFSGSAIKVYESLKSYISTKCGKKDLKLWITGYSRGGAVSNVLASLILREDEPIAIESDLYVYTFEAPAALETDNCVAYENVHNVINTNDLITNIPPASYGLGRCGVDYPIYDENASEIAKTFDEGLIIPDIYPIDADEPIDTDEEILNLLLKYMFDAEIDPSDADNDWSANTREDYVDNYQASLSYVVALIFLFKESTRAKMLNDLSNLGLGAIYILGDAQQFHDFVKPYLDEDEIEYDDDEFMSACNDVPKAVEHLFFPILLMYADTNNRQNITRLIDMHYPEVTYALLLNAHNK